MPYTATSIDVFIAAYSGCLGGMRAFRGVSQNTNPNHYSHMCLVALAFAEAFDTEYASPLPNTLQLEEIESVCSEQMNGKQPGGVPPTTAAFWTKPVLGIIALLSESDLTFAANVTNPIPIPAPPAGIPVIQIATVSGITDSLYATTPATTIAVIVDGYYAKGDDGGGLFFWNALSVATDDGGSVINPTGHVGAGRWIRVMAGFKYSVKWWGATGDGVTDDRPYCQNAIAYAIATAQTITTTGNGASSFLGIASPEIWFPKGVYCMGRASPTPGTPGYNDGLEVSGFLTVSGEGDNTILCPLPSVGNTHALVRSGNSGNVFQDIQFFNGYVAVALYGQSANFGIIGSPAGGEGNSNFFNRCRFTTQRGLSVWQDCSPVTFPANNRAIQQLTVFNDCIFDSIPTAVWGCFDGLAYNNCNFVWDQSNITPETSSDGLPLGLFNVSNHTWLNNCTLSPNQSSVGSPAWPDRQCVGVGSGNVFINNLMWFDHGACLFRNKLSQTFQGAIGEAPVVLPQDAITFGPMSLSIFGGYITCNGYNVLEIYENFPRLIYMSGMDPFNQENVYGIFVDNAIPLTDILESHGNLQVVQIDEYLGQFRRIRYGADPLDPVLQDISSVFTAYYPDRHAENFSSPTITENLFLQGLVTTVNGGGAATVATSGNDFTGDGNDTTTGYTIEKNVSTADGAAFNILTPTWGTGMPAGVYCFSLELKADFDGVIIFGYILNGAQRNLQPRRFQASGTRFQRLSFPFYYDGASTLAFQAPIFNIPNGVHWAMGLFAVHRGVTPAPYTAPVDDPTAPTTNTTSSIRTSTYQNDALAAGSAVIVGDLALDATPAVGGFIGKICTTGGIVGSGAVLTSYGYITDRAPAAFDFTTEIQFYIGGLGGTYLYSWALSGGTQVLTLQGGNFEFHSTGYNAWRTAVGSNNFFDGKENLLRAQSGVPIVASSRTDYGTARDGWWEANLSGLSVSNIAAGGNIGTAAATVDQYTAFYIQQTTAGQVLTLPAPTSATPGKEATVGGGTSATQSFTMYGVVLAPGAFAKFFWDGAAWSHYI
jgi:hypothetical protein